MSEIQKTQPIQNAQKINKTQSKVSQKAEITKIAANLFGDKDTVLKNFQQFFVGMIGAAFFLLALHIFVPSKPTIGTVNVTGIVDKFVKTQTKSAQASKDGKAAKDNMSQAQLKARVKAFGDTLEKTMKDISSAKHIILLPSEAVITGAKDYTPVVEKALAK